MKYQLDEQQNRYEQNEISEILGAHFWALRIKGIKHFNF